MIDIILFNENNKIQYNECNKIKYNEALWINATLMPLMIALLRCNKECGQVALTLKDFESTRCVLRMVQCDMAIGENETGKNKE